jgi:hypothetical protein
VRLADRFRARLLRRRPKELEGPRPLLALPAPPRRRHRPAPVEEVPLCPRCRTRHQPRPHPAGGGGLAPAYGRTILPDPDRPAPLGRGPAHDKALYRDQVNPWRHGGPEPPPPSLDWADLRAELYAPRIPWWQR